MPRRLIKSVVLKRAFGYEAAASEINLMCADNLDASGFIPLDRCEIALEKLHATSEAEVFR